MSALPPKADMLQLYREHWPSCTRVIFHSTYARETHEFSAAPTRAVHFLKLDVCFTPESGHKTT